MKHLLALATALIVTVSLASSAHADPAPEDIVTSAPNTGLPYRVDSDATSQTYDKEFGFGLADTGGDVVVDATGDEGTTVYPATQTVGSTDERTAAVHVRATPGLHTMTLTFTAEGREPETFTYQLWAAGGPPIPATGDLTGVRWAYDRGYSYDDRYVQQHDAVWFVDDRWVFLGFPKHGLPTCTAHTAGCVRYWYDEDGTGAIQIGADVIAAAWPEGMLLDGRGGWQDTDMWGRQFYGDRIGFYGRGKRLDGAWSFTDYSADTEDPGVLLRLHRDHTFRYWRDSSAGGSEVLAGHYRLGRWGALRLSGPWGSRTVTFAPCLTFSGYKAPWSCVVASFPAVGGGWTGGVLTPAWRDHGA